MPAPRSKVEVGPTEARYYDLSMDVISLGYYPSFIKRVVEKMDIQPGHAILDLGSGTGRNSSFMAPQVSPQGSILGLDISKEMLSRARKRCRSYPNVQFREQRIEMPLPYQAEFDRVFISFVLHGFEDDQKVGIINNAYRALKPGGIFCILDYNEFDIEKLWFPFRWVFIHGECQLALEFLRFDLKGMLSSRGFRDFDEDLFLRGHLRLLKATK
jgi:ubiquinone/menaquinone biosynthesis C-methylase UbiE